MVSQEQEELMSRYGYQIVGTDPLQIEHKDGDYATGRAAKLLIESVHLNQVMNKRLHQLEARLNKET